MSQFATSSLERPVSKEKHGGRRKPVSAFSEHGVLMLANVLRSKSQKSDLTPKKIFNHQR